ncbi:MAG: hypothetical protein ACREJ5_06255 [Geminicoccaceae bacterium]
MTEQVSRAHRWRPRLVLGLVIGILGQCCAPQVPGAGAGSGVAQTQAPSLPPGAIEVGEDLYQVPIGEDENGCTMYRLHSRRMLVAQAISYRDARGGFTTDRREADCITARRDQEEPDLWSRGVGE